MNFQYHQDQQLNIRNSRRISPLCFTKLLAQSTSPNRSEQAHRCIAHLWVRCLGERQVARICPEPVVTICFFELRRVTWTVREHCYFTTRMRKQTANSRQGCGRMVIVIA